MASVQGGSLVISVEADVARLQAGIAAASRAVAAGSEQMTAEAKQAAAALESVGDSSAVAAGKVDQSTSSMISDIQRATAAAAAGGRANSEYFRLLAGQRGVDVAVLDPYLQQLDAVSGRQARAGLTAGEMSNAMRTLPAQFTDIATSLAAGQSPMLVFLQQGGQLKDMFGGTIPAARALGGYVMGLISPYTLAAAAAAGLAYAYHLGSEEADAYSNALINTNNAAGTSADAMATMATRIGETVGTQHEAAAALAALAGSGNVAAANLERFASVALEASDVTGRAVEDITKEFAGLGKEPLKAALKLDESMRFLTVSTYEQISALEKQGRTTEAANLAQNAYADALASRTKEMQGNLGLIERGWNAIKDAAKSAGDAMLDVGRKETLAEQIAATRAALANAKAHAGDFSQPSGLVSQLASQLAGLEADARRQQTDANRDAEREADRKRDLALRVENDKWAAANKTRAQRRQEDLAEQKKYLDAGLINLAEYQRREAVILDKYKDPKSRKSRSTAYGSQEDRDLAQIRAQIDNEKLASRALAEHGAEATKLMPGEKLLNKLMQERSVAVTGAARAHIGAKIALAEELVELEKANLAQRKMIDSAHDLAEAISRQRQAEAEQAISLRQQYETPLERLQREHGANVRDITGNTQLTDEERERLLGRENQRNQQAVDQERNGVRDDLGMLPDTEKIVLAHEEMQRRISETWAKGSQERKRAEAANDAKLLQDQQQLAAQRLSDAASLFGSLADISAAFGGKQSGLYKAMFAANKAASIANAIVSIQAGIAKAADQPFPANLAAMATVAAQTAGIIATIKGTNLQGMAHDGIDNVPREGTWLLDRGERVVDSRTNEDLKRYLARQNQGAQGGSGDLKVVIHNHAGVNVEAQEQQGPAGRELVLLITKISRGEFSSGLSREMRQGGDLYNFVKG